MPQQLANLLLPTKRPDITPISRQTKNVEPKSGGKSNAFERTLDRQLDRNPPAKEASQAPSEAKSTAAPKETFRTNTTAKDEQATAEATANSSAVDAKNEVGTDTELNETVAANPGLVNTPVIAKFEPIEIILPVNKQPQGINIPGAAKGDEILPDTATKETAIRPGSQKPIALAQTSEQFSKELASLNSELASKTALDEAKAQLTNKSGDTKAEKATSGLLQKALSQITGFENTNAKGLATATPNTNAITALLNAADTNGTSAEISQNTEQAGITPQNAHAVSTKFGSAIQTNQSAQRAINSLAVQISKHVDMGINRFQIRMDPPELGRIDVKLEFGQDGRMTANLTVERPETLDLLLRDARALERALAQSGLNANKDSLSFSLKDQSDNEFANFNQDSESGSQSSRTNDDEMENNALLDQTLAAYRNLITSTAVDIRI